MVQHSLLCVSEVFDVVFDVVDCDEVLFIFAHDGLLSVGVKSLLRLQR